MNVNPQNAPISLLRLIQAHLNPGFPHSMAAAKAMVMAWGPALGSDTPVRPQHPRFWCKLQSKLLMLLVLYCTVANIGHTQESELLPSEQAFAFSAVLAGEDLIRVKWDIADGYYMYRDKMSFDITGQGALAAKITLPEGKIKLDPLFGDVQVYFSSLSVDLPIASNESGGYTLVAKGQGCNEPVGVCYPPITHEVSFNPASTATTGHDTSSIESSSLVAQVGNDPADGTGQIESEQGQLDLNQSSQGDTAMSSPVSSLSSAEQLRALLGSGFEQPEFLDVDDAFRLEIDHTGANRLEAAFIIADGYYLYRDKIKFNGEGAARLVEVALPPGKIKDDEYFGKIAVFQQDFSVPVAIQRQGPGAAKINVHATYQGCAEEGICYPPVNKTFTLQLPEIFSSAIAGTGDGNQASLVALTSTAATATATATASLPGILLGAFLAGLLLTFTPCVLPMIPILSSVIAGQGHNITRTKGAILALAYVLGTMVTYAGMGALAGATGDQLQAYFQNAWAIGILSTVFVLMALSMFGFFTIQMPAFIQTRLQSRAQGLSGSLPLVFTLGIVSALIVGACVSPLLISFLGLAVSRGDAWLGAQTMVTMALGMGIPLIALGLGAGYLLPKAGQWMQTINHVFGVMLIGVAIYLLGALPEVPVLLLWGSFFIIISIYMGATQSIQADAGGWRRFSKGVGTVLLVWGVVALVGGFFGERDLLKPLPGSLFATTGDQLEQSGRMQPTHLFTRVNNLAELDQQFARAARADKYVMIDYYADWCVDCTRMEKSTFQNPQVLAALTENFVSLQIDVTDPHDADGKALKKRFGVFGPPAVLFFDRNGNELKNRHFYGYRNSDEFYALITTL